MTEVSIQLFTLFGAEAGFMFFLFVLTIFAFPAHPKYAPFLADSRKRENFNLRRIEESQLRKLINLMKTKKWVPIG